MKRHKLLLAIAILAALGCIGLTVINILRTHPEI